MTPNLRHLRVFADVVETGSITRAAEQAQISQPAVTQIIAKLETQAGQPLFLRRAPGLYPTSAGEVLATRVARALMPLDRALAEVAPRLVLTASAAQLKALIAVREAENFTLAARRMGLAQPTVHRAVAQMEHEAGRPLFERRPYGLLATRQAQVLAQAARLAFAEMEQADADLAERIGREVGRIVVGAMPLARSVLLPQAIARFRQRRPTLPITALDGPYADLIAGLRRGEVDFLVGALRLPPPIADIEQRRLFDDGLVIVARAGHPALALDQPRIADLMRYPFVVATEGTPTRTAFDTLVAATPGPVSLVETGSMILMRELLRVSDHLGCISQAQVAAELRLEAIRVVPVAMGNTLRPIGLTLRRDWLPTQAQSEFLNALAEAAPR